MLTITPRSPFVVGLVARHARGREPQHVEGADEVDLDDLAEPVEVVRVAVAVERPLGPADARAVDARAQRRQLDRGRDRGPNRLLVGDVGRAEHAADVGGDGLALGGVAVDDDDLRALRREAAGGGLAHAGCAAGHERRGVLERHSRGSVQNEGRSERREAGNRTEQ